MGEGNLVIGKPFLRSSVWQLAFGHHQSDRVGVDVGFAALIMAMDRWIEAGLTLTEWQLLKERLVRDFAQEDGLLLPRDSTSICGFGWNCRVES